MLKNYSWPPSYHQVIYIEISIIENEQGEKMCDF